MPAKTDPQRTFQIELGPLRQMGRFPYNPPRDPFRPAVIILQACREGVLADKSEAALKFQDHGRLQGDEKARDGSGDLDVRQCQFTGESAFKATVKAVRHAQKNGYIVQLVGKVKLDRHCRADADLSEDLYVGIV